MFIGTAWCLLATAVACSAEKWRFPDEAAAESVRLDTKVRFTDNENAQSNRNPRVQSDEIPFGQQAEGLYNRPPGAGTYPVPVGDHLNRRPSRVSGHPNYLDSGSDESDGTLDSLPFCKCLSTPECASRPDSEKSCGAGKYLCCYKRRNQGAQHSSEFFNEVEDERPSLFPGRQDLARPFPPPPGSEVTNGFGPGHAHEVGLLGSVDRPDALIGQSRPEANNGQRRVLVGPSGPTGVIGPGQSNSAVLVGPSGPTGVIGPVNTRRDVGPSLQNVIFPDQSAQRGILVGPGGPTGIIGPPSGRRPVLVGPGGPTGIIGPNGPRNRGVLVGPGGPTGIIGPGYNQQLRPGYFARPNGPNRQVLVGPGGPTGQIGPSYYGR